VALFIDGKTFAADEMIIALGVTLTGEKVFLGRRSFNDANGTSEEMWSAICPNPTRKLDVKNCSGLL